MTKQEWLKRCELVFNMGFVNNEKCYVKYLRSASEIFLRLRFVYAKHPEWFETIKKEHQGGIAIDQLGGYETYDKTALLDNDPAYQAEVIASILDHPCQLCAEDKNAWHTRYGFCDHK